MNLANKLTVSRIIALPSGVSDRRYNLELNIPRILIISKYLALLIFIAAMVTDLFDGRIARQRKLITPFGSFFDPIADKLLISAVLVCFVEMHLMPAWMVIIIIFREFIITGLRILAVRKGVDIPADPLGKYKTISQMVMIIALLIYVVYKATLGEKINGLIITGSILDLSLYILMLITVIMTLISGYSYVRNHWGLIVEGAR